MLSGVFFPQLSMSLIFVLLVVFLTIYPRGMFGREIDQVHFPIAPYMGESTGLLRKLANVPVSISLIPKLAVLILLCLAPHWVSKYWTFLLAEIMIFALFAISFNILFGFTGMLSFGQASIFGAAAYSMSLILIHLTTSWWLAFIGSLLISTALTVIIGLCSIHRSEIYFGMLTMAFSMLFYSILYKWNSLTGGADGLSGIRALWWVLWVLPSWLSHHP